jgi:hypothetical protein
MLTTRQPKPLGVAGTIGSTANRSILEGTNKEWHSNKSLTFLKSFPPNLLPGKPVEPTDFSASFSSQGGISWSAYSIVYNIESLCR